jgi:hypothetical protein
MQSTGQAGPSAQGGASRQGEETDKSEMIERCLRYREVEADYALWDASGNKDLPALRRAIEAETALWAAQVLSRKVGLPLLKPDMERAVARWEADAKSGKVDLRSLRRAMYAQYNRWEAAFSGKRLGSNQQLPSLPPDFYRKESGMMDYGHYVIMDHRRYVTEVLRLQKLREKTGKFSSRERHYIYANSVP